MIEIVEAGYRAADTGQTQDLATTFCRAVQLLDPPSDRTARITLT